MKSDFRQPKYLNESGSKKGQYFVNRLDYFEFHQYPKYKLHKFMAFAGMLFSIYLLLQIAKVSGFIWLPYFLFSLYLAQISTVSFIILQRKMCRYRGYLLYPKKWLKFFLSIQKEVDLNDYDSCATLEKRN
jgi:hypothetical protein